VVQCAYTLIRQRWLRISGLAPWRRCYLPEQWREVLERGISEEAQLERIREATRTGRPLGTADFIPSFKV
jgi:hypothetical protein